MKKPKVVNTGMNGVDVNNQYRSYFPPGTTSRKCWKYLIWLFLNLVNAFILERIVGKKKPHQLDFHRELAKLLSACYNGYKRPSNSGKRVLETVSTEEN